MGSIEIQAVDANHASLPSFYHQGQRFVMGRYNQRYMLKVTNHSRQRYEVVMTVDGRDVISGSPGSYEQRGYVIDPYQTINIEGFRRSDSEVAAFRFTSPGDSYASRMGEGVNVGVIGVAVFSEYQAYRSRRKARRYEEEAHEYDQIDLENEATADYASPTTGSSAPAAAPRRRSHSAKKRLNRGSRQLKSEIGTRYGERRHSQIEHTQFIRQFSGPDHVLVIHYDSESGLRRRGVLSQPQVQVSPQAFPNQGYAPPPPGY